MFLSTHFEMFCKEHICNSDETAFKLRSTHSHHTVQLQITAQWVEKVLKVHVADIQKLICNTYTTGAIE